MNRWLRQVAFGTLLTVALPAAGQQVALTLPVYGEGAAGWEAYIPSVAGDGSVTLAAAVSGAPHSIRMFRYEADGSLRWQIQLPTECVQWTDSTEPYVRIGTLANGDVVAAMSDLLDNTCIGRFAASDGHAVWLKHDDPFTSYVDLVIDDSGVVTLCGVGESAGRLVARILSLESGDGGVRWVYQNPTPSYCAGLVGAGNQDTVFVYLDEYHSQRGVTRLSTSGNVQWSVTATDWIDFHTALFVDSHDNANVISRNPKNPDTAVLRTLAASDGTTITEVYFDLGIEAAHLRESGKIVAATWMTANDLTLSLLDPENGSLLWTTPLGSSACQIVPEHREGILLLCSAPANGPVELRTIAEDTGTLIATQAITGFPELADKHIVGIDNDVLVVGLSNIHGNDRNEEMIATRISVETGGNLWLVTDPLINRRSFHPATRSGDIRHATMLPAHRGVTGMILAGHNKTTGYTDSNFDFSPRVIKVAQRDGHEIWSWPIRGNPSEINGVLREVAIDSKGDVVACGREETPKSNASIVLKLDGSTGALRWLTHSPWQSSYISADSVAVDANGDVATTGESLGIQRTEKRSGVNGNLLWAREMQDTDDFYVDRFVLADAANDIIAAGRYRLQDGGASGIQSTKYRGSDGEVLWTTRISGAIGPFHDFGLLPGNDLVLTGSRAPGGLLTRLDSGTGAQVWERSGIGARVIHVDAAQRLFVAGRLNGHANIQRIDPQTGVTLWEWNPSDEDWSTVTDLTDGQDGGLLAALGNGPFAFGTVMVEAASGAQVWLTGFAAPEHDYDKGTEEAVAIHQAEEGSIFVSGYNGYLPTAATWTVFKLTGPFADDIYANGFEP